MNTEQNHKLLKTKSLTGIPAPTPCSVFSVAYVSKGLLFMEEIWKPIVGYEGLYEVSSLGRIKALPKLYYHNKTKGDVLRKERLFKQNSIDAYGYRRVGLINKLGVYKGWLSHRLVALAFIPNPHNKRCINHINGIKTDNRVENLEWVTHSENSIHSFEIGLQCNKGSKHPRALFTEAQVLEIRAKYKPHIYGRKQLAKEYGCDWTTIKDIVGRKSWNHI